MYIKLTNSERLKDLRAERGLTLKELAEQTGLSLSALGSYEADEDKEISAFSLTTLARFYGVSTDYLLGLTETTNHPNTELHELRLSDGMIDLLKSGRINNRLLCEIATHDAFPRFLADVEIYVDAIADMRINDMNAVLDITRQSILNDRKASEDDLYVRTLEVAQVSEEDYFSHVMQRDLDAITHDIRERHKADSTTADTNSAVADTTVELITGAQQAAKRLEHALRYKGTAEEKQLRLYLAQLGIDYDKLTMEELATLTNVLKKSELVKKPTKLPRRRSTLMKKRKKGK